MLLDVITLLYISVEKPSFESEIVASPSPQINESNVNHSMKNRPKPVKNIKPRMVSPTNIPIEHSISISDENWNNFHNPVTLDVDKINEKSSKK